MNESLLSKRRRVLQNPYAHIEQLDSIEGRHDIHAARRVLENPYAHLEELSGSSGNEAHLRALNPIELAARQLQIRLWESRRELWGDGSIEPLEVLDPEVAARVLGLRFELAENLGIMVERGRKIAVAGMFDRSAGSIVISRHSDPAIQNFTAAHELGHAVLHPHMIVAHRDRAMDGNGSARGRTEVEADKFAAYFLMPAKLVRNEFKSRFLAAHFELNEDTAFALSISYRDALEAFADHRALSRHLAATKYYNGRNFYSLAEMFNVTVESMAIRLEELGLLAV